MSDQIIDGQANKDTEDEKSRFRACAHVHTRAKNKFIHDALGAVQDRKSFNFSYVR